MTKKFFHPSFFLLFWIWDPEFGMGKNQDPGSGINIPDPPHCFHKGPEHIFCFKIVKVPKFV